MIDTKQTMLDLVNEGFSKCDTYEKKVRSNCIDFINSLPSDIMLPMVRVSPNGWNTELSWNIGQDHLVVTIGCRIEGKLYKSGGTVLTLTDRIAEFPTPPICLYDYIDKNMTSTLDTVNNDSAKELDTIIERFSGKNND